MTLLRRRRILPLIAALTTTAALAAQAAPAAAAATPAPGKLLATASHPITNDYVVVFHDAAVRAAAVPDVAASMAAAHGGAVGYTYQHAFHGFQFKGDARDAAAIAADPAVRYVAQSGMRHVDGGGTQNNPVWGLDRIDQRKVTADRKFTYPNDGTGVTAYIVDTGLRYTHSEFGGRAVAGLDAITEGGGAVDCHGHGTHVGGTVGGKTYGVAKNVKLVGVRVIDCDGSGPDPGVAKAIDWIIENASGPSVVNMSIGGDPFSPIDDAIRKAVATKNISFAVAAGNGDDLGRPQDACNHTPARVTEAVTVAASTSRDRSASFTNYGKCVDIFAPGVSVKSGWIGSDTATRTIDGTSMATPHVAGVMAVVLSDKPETTPAQMSTLLTDAATSDAITGVGTDSPNKLLYIGPSAR
ncbi:S8 family peptidase [Pilimelia columellifera]|uniref:S8 family peptidase n=1 Tax=Pilimelia columellifera subsp. columellifera TaxID=706583 RepID=A0ABN3MZ43_9ACTN